MQILHKVFPFLANQQSTEKHSRHYRLIHYITWELVTICAISSTLCAISQLWYLVILIVISAGLALSNLIILSRTANTSLCSHIVTLIIFLAIVSGNYLVWGIRPVHSQWFYVMPLLAASLTGMSGLLIYSTASMVFLICFNEFAIPPYYELPAHRFFIIEWVNHLFSYLIIVTTLASLIHETQRYEEELNNKNYLLQAEKDKYHHLAQFDQLTNLPNRRYFIQQLEDIIAVLAPNLCVTVFFIDLDHFKRVNDWYGHRAGDQVLLETSKRLKLCFREADLIARLGGDEFTAIITHPPSKHGLQIIAQRIINEFDPVFKLDNETEYHYSISIGSATYPDDAQTAPDLIAKADLAMYAAKKITGNSYSVATKVTS